jgi:hypothetical protein
MEQYQTKAGAKLVRRYSDLVWLQKELTEQFPDRFVPALPGLKHIGGFASVPTAVLDDHLRDAMEVFLSQVVAHPYLVKSSVLQQFLEGGQQGVRVSDYDRIAHL